MVCKYMFLNGLFPSIFCGPTYTQASKALRGHPVAACCLFCFDTAVVRRRAIIFFRDKRGAVLALAMRTAFHKGGVLHRVDGRVMLGLGRALDSAAIRRGCVFLSLVSGQHVPAGASFVIGLRFAASQLRMIVGPKHECDRRPGRPRGHTMAPRVAPFRASPGVA